MNKTVQKPKDARTLFYEKHMHGVDADATPEKIKQVFSDAADAGELSFYQKDRFIKFMTMWLTRENEYFSAEYILEWADRFKEGAEYSAHTSDSKKAYLKEIDA